jgi:hypothetical protein
MNNSVRARLALTRPKSDDADSALDDGRRLLTVEKLQLRPRRLAIPLRYDGDRHVFVREGDTSADTIVGANPHGHRASRGARMPRFGYERGPIGNDFAESESERRRDVVSDAGISAGDEIAMWPEAPVSHCCSNLRHKAQSSGRRSPRRPVIRPSAGASPMRAGQRHG